MARGKKHTREQIVSLLRQVAVANGRTTPVACRDNGITEQTYYRWRKEYGGLQADQVHLFALFGAASIFLEVHRLRCICIDADFIAPFSAEHLIYRDVVDLAGDVPKRHLHRANSACLASAAAKLRYFLEQNSQYAADSHREVGS